MIPVDKRFISISLGLLFMHDWLFAHQQSSFRFKQPWIPKISRFVALKNRPENKTSPTKLTLKKSGEKHSKRKSSFILGLKLGLNADLKFCPIGFGRLWFLFGLMLLTRSLCSHSHASENKRADLFKVRNIRRERLGCRDRRVDGRHDFTKSRKKPKMEF